MLAPATRACLLVVLAVAAGGARALPGPFEALYELRSRGMVIGEARVSWRELGNGRWEYRSESRALGLAALVRPEHVVERSRLRVEAGEELTVLHYRYERRGGPKAREVEVAFDWDREEARNTSAGRTWRMPVPRGTLDKLSYLLAVMRDLGRGRRPLEYPVADGGRLKTYRVEELGEEAIDTALGPVRARVVRRARRNGTRVTTLWCAPRLGFLPVRVEHREPDGNALRLELVSLTGPGSAALPTDSARAPAPAP